VIRLTFLSAVVVLVGLYAWKDWYKSLCGLIVLMAFLEHHDMPRTMFGIQGLNPWNILLLVIILAWMTQGNPEGVVRHPPHTFVVLLIAFLAVVITAFARLMLDRQAFPTDDSTASLISEYLVNPVKWIIPGLLLFDGCRTRSRLLWALVSILSLYVLLSMQVIRWMPADAVFNYSTLAGRSLRRLDVEIGYHRVNLSVMLAGASWALFTARTLIVSSTRGTLVLALVGVVVFAQLLTGGRGGYFAWVVVGLTLGLLRWRRCLLLAPLLALGFFLLPGVAGRAFEGIVEDGNSVSEIDTYKVTAGRNHIWEVVIDKIADEPIIGFGREAMQRTGLSDLLAEEPGEPGPGNAHNAYLEMLLDNGWIGLAIAIALFGYIVAKSFSLVRDKRNPVFAAIGGVTTALVIAELAGSLTGQSFYPREGTLGMWCAIGLMLRASVERAHANPSFAMRGHAIAGTSSTRRLEWWRPAVSSHPRPRTLRPPRPVIEVPHTGPIERRQWH
jgi:O-antigen ligase